MEVYIVSSFIVLLFIALLTFDNFMQILLAFRLNFGAFLLVLAFLSIRMPNISSLTNFLCILTIGEYLLIRLVPDLIYILPNYDGSYSISFTKLVLGGAHSFGGNRTTTGVILLTLFAFLEGTEKKNKYRYLQLLAIYCAGSGTAFALGAAYIALRYWKKFWFAIMGAPILGAILFYQEDGYYIVGKFNWGYIEWLSAHKYKQILLYWEHSDVVGAIIGLGSRSFTAVPEGLFGYGALFGDFIFLDFFARYGIVGTIILFLVPLFFARDKTIVPVWILFIGTFHYHVLFSAPGQVVFAYLIAFGLKNIKKNISIRRMRFNKHMIRCIKH